MDGTRATGGATGGTAGAATGRTNAAAIREAARERAQEGAREAGRDAAAKAAPHGLRPATPPPGTLPPGTLPPGTLPPGTPPPGTLPPETLPPGALRLVHHPLPAATGAPGAPRRAAAPGPRHEVTVRLDGADPAPARLAGVLRFLLDASSGWLAPAELARLIGAACTALAGAGAARGGGSAGGSGMAGGGGVAVSLAVEGRGQAHAWLMRPLFGVEENAFGRVDILFENDVLGLYVLAIAPGRRIPAHLHRVMAESELVLDDGLLLQGRPVAAGSAFHWPLGFVHEYRNPTEEVRRILCLDRPRFIPEDEIEVAGAPELRPPAVAGNYFA